ncbi:cyclin-dependent kinase inhibitor 1-like isoform X2 [Pistacia vera]|uniref:cyclin-dependent kinase inhibitor 1-like isoform X2 n=1 Tax=Pistacia vera TaxID=55513 RepID=UPI0012639672|nr:cyclin-dependent kinase inhibitor 1-like isoform X2 [Pistacia vera]
MEDCTNTKRIAGTVEEEMKEAEETSNTSLLSKRTKFTSQQLEDSENNDEEYYNNVLPSANNELKNDHVSVQTATSSAFFSAPRSSSNDSLQIVKDSLSSTDLELGLRGRHNKFRVYLREVTSFETDISTSNNNFREASPLREICVASQKASMDSVLANKPPTSRRGIPPAVTVSAARMPSLVEIDEFFSATEKNEQKRFAEKYNYDIEKDVPLEGRYQWIQLKP